jgi:hypothetical protein
LQAGDGTVMHKFAAALVLAGAGDYSVVHIVKTRGQGLVYIR